LVNQDFEAAITNFRTSLQSGELNPEQRPEALIGLGQANLAEGHYSEAADAFGEFLASAGRRVYRADSAGDAYGEGAAPAVSEATFFLAQTYRNQGNCAAAVGAYRSYLTHNPDMSAYIQPLIAECQTLSGDLRAAIDSYRSAVEGEALLDVELIVAERLAELLIETGEYTEALSQFGLILEKATEDEIRGRVAYKAGVVERLLGDEEAAYDYFRVAIDDHPQAYESYLALIVLIEAGVEVNSFQRGLVDLEARAYEPAILSFKDHIAANPEHDEEAHLYLAWSYEAMGNTGEAVAQMDTYIEAHEPAAGEGRSDDPNLAKGWIERARLQSRAGSYGEAADSYLTFLELFPEDDRAPLAAWWAAYLPEIDGQVNKAIERYLVLAEQYPDHEDAAEALFRAGYLTLEEGDDGYAMELWLEAAQSYPYQPFGAASLIWLIRTAAEEDAEQYRAQAQSLSGDSYYTIRARDVASDTVPFSTVDVLQLTPPINEDEAAETWFRERFELGDDIELSITSSEIMADSRLIRGAKLWRLGLYAEASRELEDLRKSYEDDPVQTYALARIYRDLGNYRSSILAAERVMELAEVDVFEAPLSLARLAYPVYYADLILAESEMYGTDPLLQFALIRQESLFESFATSSAVAQGLGQVIPATGEYIAQRLNWPDFENDDLYKPYVGIAFGAYYLYQQLLNFDDNVAVAISGYNGGPGNAARWYKQAPDDLDLYLEVVDFAETRLYIKRIYAGQAIYQHIYGGS
jgi:soluble lytic murein transglycosylase